MIRVLEARTVREHYDRHGSDLVRKNGGTWLWIEKHDKGLTVVDSNCSARDLSYQDDSDDNVASLIAKWMDIVEW